MNQLSQHNEGESTGLQAEHMVVNINSTPKNKSIIADVVNIISKLDVSDIDISSPHVLPAAIKAKLEHNNVIKSRYIIESYKCNTIDLNNAYETLEQEMPGRKQKLLRIIREIYQKELGEISCPEKPTIDAIREKSDEILKNITTDLRARVLESSNLQADNEDVDIAIRLIVADAFIECLVLENPEALK